MHTISVARSVYFRGFSVSFLITYIIIIIIVASSFIAFMQGIYNYIPETNHVSRVYSIAAIP
jgi:hypothetical protein